MVKQILALQLFLFTCFSIAVGQNLTLSLGSTPLANNETVEIWGDSGLYTVIESHVTVNNNSSSSIDVLVKKTEISTIAGSENSFCWGTCYLPATFVSPSPIAIPGDSSNSGGFIGDYKPKGNLGSTTIRYTFFNKQNANDSVAFIVIYSAGVTAINDNPSVVEFSNAYPNPASNFVNFNYNLQGTSSAEFVITDLLGSELYRAELENENNKLMIDVASFNAGVYFYSLRVDGKMQFTRKLIVRH